MLTIFKKIAYAWKNPTRHLSKEKAQTSARYGGMGERELQLRIEMLVEDSITDPQRSIFATAKELASFGLIDQERFLQALRRCTGLNQELGYQFCKHGVKALRKLDGDDWTTWLGFIEQTLRGDGCRKAVDCLQDLDSYLKKISLPPQAVTLSDAVPILERMLTALGGRSGRGGRSLAIEKAQKAQEVYTDTDKIYLPEHCSHYDKYDDNFALYKVWTIYQWAQCRFGTWDIYNSHTLNERPPTDKVAQIFQILENLRLDACIERELPGTARMLKRIGAQADFLPDDDAWQTARQRLADPNAAARDSLNIAAKMTDVSLPKSPLYQGVIKPQAVEKTMTARIEQDKETLQKELSEYLVSLKSEGSALSPWSLEVQDSATTRYEFELKYDDTPVNLTPEMQEALESIMQDLGEVPPEYLQAEQREQTKDLDTQPAADNAAAALLPEWDYSIGKYRQDWCRIFVDSGSEGDAQFVTETLSKHRHLITRLRRSFEALRFGDVRMTRQPEGDEIDIDAAMQTLVDVRSGNSPRQDIYIKNRKADRNIAVMFMVDLSGSTAGWVNQVEKEALLLLCEALETLGDRYAIYGFSTYTRKQCNLSEIKTFAEPYHSKTGRKIAALHPTGYTRLGAATRFLSEQLLNAEAQTRILITLSDGKPDDRDGYGGAYGVEDTRRAILEASFRGIHPYCITIDNRAQDYLPYMYNANFSIINDVAKLPFKVSDIYRRITS